MPGNVVKLVSNAVIREEQERIKSEKKKAEQVAAALAQDVKYFWDTIKEGRTKPNECVKVYEYHREGRSPLSAQEVRDALWDARPDPSEHEAYEIVATVEKDWTEQFNWGVVACIRLLSE